MVEHRLPKPVVAGSIPVSRSNFSLLILTQPHGWFSQGGPREMSYCPYCPPKDENLSKRGLACESCERCE
jgi:hypothetical protein